MMFMPQNLKSHTKARFVGVLRCLGRTGLRLGGKLADPKKVLAERLAYWLNQVLEAGREPSGQHDADLCLDGADLESDDDVEK